MYNTHGHFLQDINQIWLLRQQLERYAPAVSDKASPLEHCWDFINGTVRPVCCPGSNQRVLYNGHQRVHATKFQVITVTNGMIGNLYGSVEGTSNGSPLFV